MQLEGGSGILRALSYYYHNDDAAVAALAGASFENVANMTRPDPCAVTDTDTDICTEGCCMGCMLYGAV